MRLAIVALCAAAACETEGARHRDVPLADGFDFPVGAPDGVGYHDAQRFGENHHLGEDWNGDRGGDSDLGDPVHAIATGRVAFAADVGGGWGNVVRVIHRVRERGHVRDLESLYAHLDTIAVRVGDDVARGEVIGAIGTAGGQYLAHLHLELRAAPGLALGGGYGTPFGQVDPTAYIRTHR